VTVFGRGADHSGYDADSVRVLPYPRNRDKFRWRITAERLNGRRVLTLAITTTREEADRVAEELAVEMALS
jgi:hypothetical protein